ncbi:MAG: hypothetical protein MUO31_00860 [Thermodesulfovibrionales bacterium]|nr:hypothetical protein [Thermodesulfovibrionales bacterium]
MTAQETLTAQNTMIRGLKVIIETKNLHIASLNKQIKDLKEKVKENE